MDVRCFECFFARSTAIFLRGFFAWPLWVFGLHAHGAECRHRRAITVNLNVKIQHENLRERVDKDVEELFRLEKACSEFALVLFTNTRR